MKKVFVKIVLKTSATVMLIMVVGLISLLAVSPVVNDAYAKETADELASLPLPNDTEYIESVYQAGKLVGCGNGMDYFGAILIKSGLSLDELKEYYSGFAENEWECVVEKQERSHIDMIEHEQLVFKTEVEGGRYYIVYTWGNYDTVFSGFDIRGH